MAGQDEVARIKFGPGTCAKHRAVFVSIVVDCGVRDWALMERVRLRVVAECGRHLPPALVRRYLTDSCIGCEMMSWVGPVIERMAQEEKMMAEPVG